MKHWHETREVLDFLALVLGEGQRAALATVVRVRGSAYRHEGEEVQHFSGLVPVFHELFWNLLRRAPALLAVGPGVPSPLLSRTKEERRHSVKHLAWFLIFAALPAALVT